MTSQKWVKTERYGKLMFVIQARVYPSTACAPTNWSMNSVFLTLCLHTNSDCLYGEDVFHNG